MRRAVAPRGATPCLVALALAIGGAGALWVIFRGDPDRFWAPAAARAARLCRFTPAKQREIPVKAWVAVPYRFRLR